LGITPSNPNTGYGYIRYEPLLSATGVYRVEQFTEKPDLPTAMKFLAGGDHLWNSGIFIWKIRDIIDAFQCHLPDMYTLFAAGESELNTSAEKCVISRIYRHCESVSIDVGIMEKADDVYVIPSDFQWSDLGTWNSAYDNFPKDPANNALAGENIVVKDSNGCMVHAAGKKLILLQGMDNLIVVDTPDALLICKKENEQQIKEYVAEIRSVKGDGFL
jgi:mannose-1-phosphate guanylyltransferase